MLTLALPSRSNAELIAYLSPVDDYWQVWLVSPDGTGARQLTHSTSEKARCAWFPDHRRVLVSTLEGRLYEVDVETGAERPLELTMEGMLDATVSPDGQRMAFSLSTGGSYDDNEIWTTRIDGSDAKRLTNMPWLQHQPSWSPGGTWIYFVSGDGGQSHDIWRVAPGTGAKEQMTAGSLYHLDVDALDDDRIAFSSNRSGDYEIYTQTVGQQPVRRTENPGLDGGPSWSPRGDAIVFHSWRDGALNLWRLDLRAGAEPVQITSHASGARSPAWGGLPEAAVE